MTTNKEPETAEIIAASQMDWTQPVLNCGEPCFHICSDGRFCGRAPRWDGHLHLQPDEVCHKHLPFPQFIRRIMTASEKRGMESMLPLQQACEHLAALPNVENRISGWTDINKAIADILTAITQLPEREGK